MHRHHRSSLGRNTTHPQASTALTRCRLNSEYDAIPLVTTGIGPKTIILVHGGCGRKEEWQAVQKILSRSYRVISFDLPGHGQSKSASLPTIEHLGSITTEVRRKGTPNGHCAILVGHSMGSYVVMDSYRQDPSNVGAIVIIENIRMAQHGENARHEMAMHLDRVGAKFMLTNILPAMFPHGTEHKVVVQLLTQLNDISEDVLKSLILDSIDWELKHLDRALQSLRVPLKIIQSTIGSICHSPFSHDEIPGIASVRAHSPSVQVATLPGASHYPHIVRPAEVSEEIARLAIQLP